MIELRSVYKVFQNNTEVLSDITLHIGREEFVFIVGPSGAGKTTLMYIIGMLDDASEGEYFF